MDGDSKQMEASETPSDALEQAIQGGQGETVEGLSVSESQPSEPLEDEIETKSAELAVPEAMDEAVLDDSEAEPEETLVGDSTLKPGQHQYVKLHLVPNEAGDVLNAHIIESDEAVTITTKNIIKMYEDSEYTELFFIKDNIEKIIRALDARRQKVIPLAEKRDASSEIQIDEDQMTAYITTHKASGGIPLTEESIRDGLQKSGVVEGVIAEAVEAVLATASVTDYPIARGKEPERGEDTQFECLVKECLFKGPAIDDSGKVDFFDLQEFILVEADTPIMQRKPATQGQGGYTVHGEALPAKPGKDIPFRIDEGVQVSSDDESIIISTTKGHPVIYPDGAKVDPTLRLARIDLSTGNVRFDGSLYVKGDIADNMTVEVTGNVLVDGVIQKARVTAGGDVLVKNGVIGGAVVHTEDELVQHYGAHIKAEGDIQARFIDNARLDAGQVVLVREYIRHSLTVAGRQILLGKQGGRGQLIGGKASATNSVQAKIMGTQADVHTYVEVGVAPSMRAKYDSLSSQLELRNREMNGLVTSFGYMKAKRESKEGLSPVDEKDMKDVANTIRLTLVDIEQLTAEREELESKMSEAKDAFVEAEKRIYRNLQVKIKDALFKVNESYSGGRFTLNGKRVDYSGRSLAKKEPPKEQEERE